MTYFVYLKRLIILECVIVSFQSALTTDQMAESQELFPTQVSFRQTIKGIIPIIQQLFWEKNVPFESINNALHHLSIVKMGTGAWGLQTSEKLLCRDFQRCHHGGSCLAPGSQMANGYYLSSSGLLVFV